jgi:hypothetical protein
MMAQEVKPKKILNPALKTSFWVTIIITALIVVPFTIHRTGLGPAVGGAAAVLIALGIVGLIARSKGIDMYIPNEEVGNNAGRGNAVSPDQDHSFKVRTLMFFRWMFAVFFILAGVIGLIAPIRTHHTLNLNRVLAYIDYLSAGVVISPPFLRYLYKLTGKMMWGRTALMWLLLILVGAFLVNATR